MVDVVVIGITKKGMAFAIPIAGVAIFAGLTRYNF